MAAADDAVDGAEKSSTTFRCLDVARLVVAVAVTVLIVTVIAYAVSVVLRPGEILLWVPAGSVSAKRSHENNLTKPYDYGPGDGNLTFAYTVRASNPSGRVRIYFTEIHTKLKAMNSSREENSFLSLSLPDPIVLAPDSTVDTFVTKESSPRQEEKYSFQEEYFRLLGNGTGIDDAWLELKGNLTVENVAGHNMTAVTATYYCWPLSVIRSDQDDGKAANDVLCTPNAPTGATSSPAG